MLHGAFIEIPKPRTADQFFGQLCPEVLTQRQEACRAVGGSIAFSLSEDERWILDLGQVVCYLERIPKSAVDLEVTIDTVHFNGVLKGSLQLKNLLAQGTATLAGDLAMLGKVALIFS